MIRTPAHYQRRARRRLTRFVFYWVVGGISGGLMYLVIGLYVSLFN